MASRLPGIYFETIVPPVAETLPRMDIAAFVGFAASGPLDVPVAIEDAGRFTEIFGADQTLAWDSVRGEPVYAQMPPAVRAFLRNNGQRCWVVRVARVADDGSAAISNQFLAPGLLRSIGGIPYQGAWLDARSEGSWSDDWAVNATLSFQPIAAEPPQRIGRFNSPPGPGISVVLHPESANLVAPGDLLEMLFDGVGTAGQVVAFLPVDSLASERKTTLGAVQQVTTVTGGLGYWFRKVVAADFLPLQSPSLITASEPLDPPAHVYRLVPPEDVELDVSAWAIEPGSDGPVFVLDAPRDQLEDIAPGSWLRLALAPGRLPSGATDLLALVDEVRGSAATYVVPVSPSEEESFQIVFSDAWWVLTPDAGWAASSGLPRTGLVTMELWARDGDGRVSTLDCLGFTPQHPLYLGYLPTDAQLFSISPGPVEPPGDEVRTAADHPRFALAAPPEDLTSGNGLPVYLPLGIPGLLAADHYQPALTQTATELQRDGLALEGGIAYSDLFLDPDLAGATVDTLSSEAFHKQYELPRRDGPGIGEPLEKLHAVLPLDEVSMIAVPDAALPGWHLALTVSEPLGAPVLLPVQVASQAGDVAVSWSAVDGATSYTLQQSADPQFATPTAIGAIPQTSTQVAPPSGCPRTSYFRVQATQGAIVGPWSNTVSRILPVQAFEGCLERDIAPPSLSSPLTGRGRVLLQWSIPAGGVDAFQLQMSVDPAFALPAILYNGPDDNLEVWREPSRTAYFRVSASRGGAASPWSNTVAVPPAPAAAGGTRSSGAYSRYEMNQPGAATADQFALELPKIHQAMLRLGAARGDLVVLLSLPRDFSTDDAVLYQSQLTSAMAPEDGDRTLSFGTIYHPWLVVRDASDDKPGAIRSVVADGSIAGSFAERTLASGAWFSPANQALLGTVDLEGHGDNLDPLTFFNTQLNLILQEPSGFRSMSSFTLSPAPELTEMNVRRLLILLRRLALREGQDYVFESNDDALRRTVRRRFEDVLGDLFLRGAFAGATPDDSFRVRTDDSVNPPDAVDQGIFVVELQVAPSYPMEFVTVRLVQTGGEVQLSEEF